jgi:hypothetical protein
MDYKNNNMNTNMEKGRGNKRPIKFKIGTKKRFLSKIVSKRVW